MRGADRLCKVEIRGVQGLILWDTANDIMKTELVLL